MDPAFADVEVLVIFLPMMQTDSLEAARAAAEPFRGTRAHLFWDGDRVLARRVAPSLPLDPGVVAWDVYLRFERDVRWTDAPPPPAAWVHQLRGADPARFRGGNIAQGVTEMLRAR